MLARHVKHIIHNMQHSVTQRIANRHCAAVADKACLCEQQAGSVQDLDAHETNIGPDMLDRITI